MPSAKSNDPIIAKKKKKSSQELTEDEQRQLQEHATQTQERQAATQFDLAKLFLDKDKTEIALRRLKELVAMYPETAAAKAARTMLKRFPSPGARSG